jgi:hypothetical protein
MEGERRRGWHHGFSWKLKVITVTHPSGWIGYNRKVYAQDLEKYIISEDAPEPGTTQ